MQIGQLIDDHYEVISLLGDGGMGSVYKARTIGVDRVVALKVLHATLAGDIENRRRFESEGRMLAALRHSNIPVFYHFGVWNQFPYLVMEFLDGSSLRELLNGGPSPGLHPDRVAHIVLQVCEGMQVAHEAGIIHRDLKPNNIMLVEAEDQREQVKILDFGLAFDSSRSQRFTRTGELIGSVFYMSPEQCSGARVDHRSDIYAVGCLLFECLTGRCPFYSDNPIGLMHQHVSAPTPDLPKNLPSGWAQVVARAMEKSPEDRYQSMSEMRNDLMLIRNNRGQEIAYTRDKKINHMKNPVVNLGAALVIASLLVPIVLMKFSNSSLDSNTESKKAPALAIPRLYPGNTIVAQRFPELQARAAALKQWIQRYGATEVDGCGDACASMAHCLELMGAKFAEKQYYVDLGLKAYERALTPYLEKPPEVVPHNVVTMLSGISLLQRMCGRYDSGLKIVKKAYALWYPVLSDGEKLLVLERWFFFARFFKDDEAVNEIFAQLEKLSLPQSEKGKILINRSLYLIDMDRKDEAKKFADQAAANFTQPGKLWIDLARIYASLGDFKLATKYVTPVKDGLTKPHYSRSERYWLCDALARCAVNDKKYAQAVEYLKEQLKYGDPDNCWGIVGAIMRIASVGNVAIDDEALVSSQIASRSDPVVSMSGLLSVSLIMHDNGQKEKALQLQRRAIALLDGLSDSDFISHSDSVAAMISLYNSAGRFDQALKLYELEISRLRKLSTSLVSGKGSLALCLSQAAVAAAGVKNVAMARELVRESLELARKPPIDQNVLARALQSQGILLQHQGDYLQASNVFTEAIEMSTENTAIKLEIEDNLKNLHSIARVEVLNGPRRRR